jgi:hypothetical protein
MQNKLSKNIPENFVGGVVKMRLESAKRVAVNVLVDITSIILISASLYSASLAAYTLYSSFYKTFSFPTPEAFSAASFQLSTAISFVFAVFFARKYRKKEEKDGTDKKEKI